MPYDARKIAASLQRKGFSPRQNDHTFFHLIIDGKDAGIFTKLSHGEREIGMPLAKMRHQMKLACSSDFRDFVECPMSSEDYLAALRRHGHLYHGDSTCWAADRRPPPASKSALSIAEVRPRCTHFDAKLRWVGRRAREEVG